jgi:glycine cleavage system H lipoate-binding protein/ABC-type phosphate transport system substrate-binding protein
MKRLSFLFLAASLFLTCQVYGVKSGEDSGKTGSVKGTLTVSAAPELMGLATRWVEDFTTTFPNVRARVIPAIPGEKPASETGLVIAETKPGMETGAPSGWRMVIGRDAVVGILNTANPSMEAIQSRGINSAQIAGLFNGEGVTWGRLTGTENGSAIHIYIVDNTLTAQALAAYTGLADNGLTAIRLSTGQELIDRVSTDPGAVGFCNLATLTATGDDLAGKGISLLPIDKNTNGRLDYIERIYANPADIYRGIWIGKYPQDLCRNLYVTALQRPEQDDELAFIRFTLTTGQDYLALGGFTRLTNAERLSGIDRLPLTVPGGEIKGINLTQLLITILAGLLFLLAIVSFIIRNRRLYRPDLAMEEADQRSSFGEATISVPKGLYFSKSHTWAFLETNGTVKVGVDDFMQHVTGEITSVKIRKTGERVVKGEPILTVIQKGKRLELASPVSGTIQAINNILYTDPSKINSSPYKDGWICLIEPVSWIRETQLLLMADRYREWIRGEFTRLKDFLAGILRHEDPKFAMVVLQDGGEIRDNLLEHFGPEVWEEFQMSFINKTNL